MAAAQQAGLFTIASSSTTNLGTVVRHVSTLNNCTLTGNSASSSAAGSSVLNNCALAGNSAFFKGLS